MAPNPIRTLLIEDNRLEARLTQQWLGAPGEVTFEAEVVDRVSAAVARLARGGIDLVVSDLNLPDSRGLETFTRVQAAAPDVPIVVLTGQNDEALAMKAVEAGAQDYLVKSRVDGATAARVFRYAVARHRAQAERSGRAAGKPARVYGFLGVKGGVGTTTVALNVALALARQQKSVVLAEVRPTFGTLAFQLRHTPAENLTHLLDLPPQRIDERELSARLCKGPAGLRLLYGPQKVEEFRELPPAAVEAVIQGLARTAEYVFLDLPCQPSPATQAAVRLCHYLALVTEREPGSVFAGRVMLDVLRSWGVSGGMAGAVVVVRMASGAPMKLPEMQAQLGCDLVGMIPPRDGRLPARPGVRQPAHPGPARTDRVHEPGRTGHAFYRCEGRDSAGLKVRAHGPRVTAVHRRRRHSNVQPGLPR
jgi:MinD-like ATPase involved in chromosome partitioning or flagellar assembly/ActR/RegA family two-component response regulator